MVIMSACSLPSAAWPRSISTWKCYRRKLTWGVYTWGFKGYRVVASYEPI